MPVPAGPMPKLMSCSRIACAGSRAGAACARAGRARRVCSSGRSVSALAAHGAHASPLDQCELDVLGRSPAARSARRSARAPPIARATCAAAPSTRNSSPRRMMVTSSAASIWRRFPSSAPRQMREARVVASAVKTWRVWLTGDLGALARGTGKRRNKRRELSRPRSGGRPHQPLASGIWVAQVRPQPEPRRRLAPSARDNSSPRNECGSAADDAHVDAGGRRANRGSDRRS